MLNPEKTDEEFNNFMHKVNEVSGIVKKLASCDKKLQNIGCLEAEKLLAGQSKGANFDENLCDEVKCKTDRTVINRAAFMKDNHKDQETMSQQAFMDEVSRDADRRYKDKMIRKEKTETLKKQAVLAFNRQEYELALSRYTKAIEQIRDSCGLYLDRAITEINLQLYDKAIEDCKTALRLNEDSLRAWLLLAKAHYMVDDSKREFELDIKEAKERNPRKSNFIDQYMEEKIKSVCDVEK